MAVGKCVLSVLVRFHLLAAFTQMNPSQSKRQQPDSANGVVCAQTLAITGTSSSVLADQKLSTSFSAVDEAFPLSSSSFCLLHPHPLRSLFLLFTSTCFSQFAMPGSLFFSPLRFVFCLRSWFSKSPALRSTGSKDTCGDCVHSRAFVRFIKGKPAEWNCSFLNSWADWKTERRGGERILMAGKNIASLGSPLNLRVRDWWRVWREVSKSRGVGGRRGSKRLRKILSENATKGRGCGILLQWLSNWYFPGMQVLKVNGLVLSDSKAKHPWASSMEQRLHPGNKIVKLQRTWSASQCEPCFCNTSVERDKRDEMKALSNFSGRIQQAKIYIGLKKHWGSSKRPQVSEVQKLKLSQ